MDINKDITFATLWSSLRDPVLVLAEELAVLKVHAQPPAVCFRIHAGGIDIEKTEGGKRELLLSVAGHPRQATQEFLAALQPEGLEGDVAIEFAEDQAVNKEIMLPQQPDDVLNAIVRNKVEGLAPWPLAQCLWGMRARPMADDPRQLAVDVAVVSRTLMEGLAADLRAAGAEVRSVSVRLSDHQSIRIDHGGEDVRRIGREWAVKLAKAAAVLCLLVAGPGLFAIYRASSEASLLEENTAEIMQSIKGGGAGFGETPMLAAANRLRQQRLDHAPTVADLNELSSLLPDTVYLTALTLDGDKLEVKGQGSGVPGLIEILESSTRFKDVNFAAATELDANSNADAFSLSATLEPAQQATP
ncbi:PilN domain-containing protein [Aestuariivirga sp.]|uniref:PilN domain-containing protein n=1 Tax=Aestuariivirga sp. TaxID=2650926 RepID=UPI003BAC7E0C